ncbi:MAG: UPF0182 family protein [Desulfobacteraceae bacterium]|nr:UPF0182 family protein [Desulfobacteraceae bacterium]
MKKTHRRLLLFAAVFGAAVLSVMILKIVFVDFVVDFWWFQSQGLAAYFLLRHLYRYLVFAAAALLFFFFFAANFSLATRFVGVGGGAKEKKELLRFLHEGLQRVYLPLSGLLALLLAAPLFRHWEETLLYLFGPAGGMQDPLMGKDIGFYLFSLPVYAIVQKELLAALVVLFFGVAFLYWYEHRVVLGKEKDLPKGAKIHTAVLLLLIFAMLSWGLFLQRYSLLYVEDYQPLFFGPGYVEMRVILPLIWVSALSLMGAGVSLVLLLHRGKGLFAMIAFVLLFIGSTVARNSDMLAEAVWKYVVQPNQILRDRPFIEANIKATLAAYGLDRVEIRDYPTDTAAGFSADDPDLIRRLRNIPVWDREMLGGVYEELQGIRTYFSFPTIDVDRYAVDGEVRQVYLGAREIDMRKLPDFARNWINVHLQYTHGQGAVMIPAAQAGDEFMTWFLKDIPPTSDFGIRSENMAVYYGLADKPYVIAPNDVGEIGSPSGDEETIVHYEGTGGVPIHSLWRKALFALYFGERNIFFTTKTNEKSRILFRRNIRDRIHTITPYLLLDEDPYLVVAPSGLYWIQDAYTTSDRFPLAPQVQPGVNYIRNAVKIVVDAYNGKSTYYVAEKDDPIITAYRRMYPGLFRPMEEMPDVIRDHVRYPKDIFRAQVSMYAKYHQTDPERFFRQEDIWEPSEVFQGRKLVSAKPYYLTLDLIEPEKQEFLLFMPMSPFGRDNLRALVIAGSGRESYGRVFAYRFSRDRQVYGPAQVHSLVNQDIVISEQFTLWDQEGSEVILGKMIIEPTDGNLLYIQPVYLQEEGPLKIPQLKRLIMSVGDAVVMAPSLEEAAVALEAELLRKKSRMRQRFPAAGTETQKSESGEKNPASKGSPPSDGNTPPSPPRPEARPEGVSSRPTGPGDAAGKENDNKQGGKP